MAVPASYTLSGMSVRSFSVGVVASARAPRPWPRCRRRSQRLPRHRAAIRGRRSGNRRTIPRTWRHRTRRPSRRPAGRAACLRRHQWRTTPRRNVPAARQASRPCRIPRRSTGGCRVVEGLLERGRDEFDGRVVGGHAVAHQPNGTGSFSNRSMRALVPSPSSSPSLPSWRRKISEE